MGVAEKQVVLSLFPGADFFGKAFESRGFCVVRGPELLLGQDIRDFHVPVGRFDGIIGGPPCQGFSKADIKNLSTKPDLIGEFARIIKEAEPTWFVMENVEAAIDSPHVDQSWIRFKVRDWDCGGRTFRPRLFWFSPNDLALRVVLPARRPGKPEYTLCASDGRRGGRGSWVKGGQPGISLEAACELQGFAGLFKRGKFMSKSFGIHLLGNGVPRAMGEWVADQVVRWLKSKGK